MSIVTEYWPLFTVTVEEDGSAEPLEGFRFEPSSACRRVMADHFLVFKHRQTGFQVYYQQNPTVASPILGEISRRVRLTFTIKTIPPGLFDAYEPDLTAQTGPQIYLDNLTPSGNIQGKSTLTVSTTVQAGDAIRVHPHVFFATADLTLTPTATEFEVVEYFDPSVSVQTAGIPQGGASGTAKIDLTGKDSGPYLLETDSSAIPARNLYVDTALAFSPSHGVVDLYWETSQAGAPAGGVAYQIRFRRR